MERYEAVDSKERLKTHFRNAIAAGALLVLPSCEKKLDYLEMFNALNVSIVKTDQAANLFWEKLWIENDDMISILQKLDHGIQGEPIESLSHELRSLSIRGKTEFAFSIYKNEYGVWQLAGMRQGDDRSAKIPKSEEFGTPYLDAVEVMAIHNHPLITMTEMGSDNGRAQNLESTSTETENDFKKIQIDLVTSGEILPIPMPPSSGDLRTCSYMTEELSLNSTIAYSCAVASVDGVWKISVDPLKSKEARKDFELQDELYTQKHLELFTNYSDRALTDVLLGDKTQYAHEYNDRQQILKEMMEIVASTGFTVEFTTYN